MLHGASPDEAVSAHGPIAIRYRSPFWFSKEHDFHRTQMILFYFLMTAGPGHQENARILFVENSGLNSAPFSPRTLRLVC